MALTSSTQYWTNSAWLNVFELTVLCSAQTPNSTKFVTARYAITEGVGVGVGITAVVSPNGSREELSPDPLPEAGGYKAQQSERSSSPFEIIFI